MIYRFAAAASAAIVFCCGFASAAEPASELKVTLENFRSDKGQVLICVFSAESSAVDTFPDCMKGRPVRQGKLSIKGGKVVVSYSGLKDGVYAVAAVHDENGNGELDTNFLGVPTEGIGISNNPQLLGKPQFPEARFEIKGKTGITVSIKYIL
jgi:uncharacterized protein (DUF2141 family)